MQPPLGRIFVYVLFRGLLLTRTEKSIDAGRRFPEPLHDGLFLLTGCVTGTKIQDNWLDGRMETKKYDGN